MEPRDVCQRHGLLQRTARQIWRTGGVHFEDFNAFCKMQWNSVVCNTLIWRAVCCNIVGVRGQKQNGVNVYPL